MPQPIRIAVDAMGGDLGPRATFPASIEFARKYPQIRLSVFYTATDDFNELLTRFSSLPANLSIIETDCFVSMEDSATSALRNKINSSMAKAITALEEDEADVCVSCGNTAALMALGCHILGTFDNIRRPAIGKAIPTVTSHSYMLDLGANTNTDSPSLVNFARMGSALAETNGISTNPKVALLNIGAEDIKGNQVIREAHDLLTAEPNINYVGFIEGDSIYSGDVDVIVCDGFVGNVALKVSEGVAKMALTQLKSSFKQNLYGRLLGRFARPLLRKWHKQFDPARYNGAYFLGLNKPVIKSHGASDERSFSCALEQAYDMANRHLVERLKQQCATASAK